MRQKDQYGWPDLRWTNPECEDMCREATTRAVNPHPSARLRRCRTASPGKNIHARRHLPAHIRCGETRGRGRPPVRRVRGAARVAVPDSDCGADGSADRARDSDACSDQHRDSKSPANSEPYAEPEPDAEGTR